VTWDSEHLLTGSGDSTAKLWSVSTGQTISTFNAKSMVKSVSIGYSGQLFAICNVQRSSPTVHAYLSILDIREGQHLMGGMKCIKEIKLDDTALSCAYTHLDDRIAVGHKNGGINMYDMRAGDNEPVSFAKDHKGEVRDLQVSQDRLLLISASADKTAQLYEARSLNSLNKKYVSERPVNSAAISPTRDHIMLGGGEDAMKVTQTSVMGAHFEAKFYHLVFAEEFANIKGHFGPINSLCYHPDGNTFITGAEDGYVRINTFDEEFKSFEFDS